MIYRDCLNQDEQDVRMNRMFFLKKIIKFLYAIMQIQVKARYQLII